jgi:hypothetical protein
LSIGIDGTRSGVDGFDRSGFGSKQRIKRKVLAEGSRVLSGVRLNREKVLGLSCARVTAPKLKPKERFWLKLRRRL